MNKLSLGISKLVHRKKSTAFFGPNAPMCLDEFGKEVFLLWLKLHDSARVAIPLQTRRRPTLRLFATTNRRLIRKSLMKLKVEVVGADGIEPSTPRV